MSWQAAERIARALLFEGYALYPYRASSLKNRQRWPLGTLYPAAFCALGQGDSARMQCNCLVYGSAPSVEVSLRFLQMLPAEPTSGAGWSEAIDRRVDSEVLPISLLSDSPCMLERHVDALHLRITVGAQALSPDLHKLQITIDNLTSFDPASHDRAAAQLHALVSTHTLLRCTGGRFVSLLEPAPEHAAAAKQCHNAGCWPVLVGDTSDDVVLCSPVILYDRPKIAPESQGDYFDATEIDEMLALRVLTLSEAEREEIRRGDPRLRALLERTEQMAEADLARLHGAYRDPEHEAERAEQRAKAAFSRGDRVRLRPRKGGDILDLALAGEAATVVGVEEDFDGRLHYMVTVDADPGADLGLSGQPGHRFFFSEAELERSEP